MGNVRKITRQGAAKMACSILAQYEVVKREYDVIDCRIKFGLGTDSDRALVLEHSYRLHSLVRDAARYISDVFWCERSQAVEWIENDFADLVTDLISVAYPKFDSN